MAGWLCWVEGTPRGNYQPLAHWSHHRELPYPKVTRNPRCSAARLWLRHDTAAGGQPEPGRTHLSHRHSGFLSPTIHQ
ncbi:hypothetical protein Pmani_001991 [Petrolisthes manimaculis]|uniref:Uncharacterized protein n=1 Tax=Petrolisthes manimaculis TaxID=1843537 RepID=A0AAE1QIU2_9EUCA|nr:hypothetical protein Pmani_001991 [Petrolisthes manimaculis]